MMAPSISAVRETALRLPTEERAALAHELIASLDAGEEDQDAGALWVTEIDRRAREVADGSVTLIDADAVHAEINDRLLAKRGR